MKPKQTFVVGVDLGGTKILAGVFDDRHRVVAREKKGTRPELGPETVLDRVAACVNEALASAVIPHTAVAGLGIGMPGLVDSRAGYTPTPALSHAVLTYNRTAGNGGVADGIVITSEPS